MDGFRMDRTALTSGDMQAILAGLRSLDSISGTNQYRQLMEKISPGSSDLLSGDQYIMIDLASWHKAYAVESVPDNKDGTTNVALLRTLISEYASRGWRLHQTLVNELGRNEDEFG